MTKPSRTTCTVHDWTGVHSELLWIYDGPYASSTPGQVTDHRIGYWAWLIRKGHVRVQMGRQSWEAHEGQWIICPQGVATQHFSKDARILSVRFLCQWSTSENLFFERQASVFDSSEFPRLVKTGSALCRLVHHYFPNATIDFSFLEVDYDVFLRFQNLFCQWLIEFNHVWKGLGRKLVNAEIGDDKLRKAIRYLNDSPLDEPFPVVGLLHDVGLGRARLDRLFFAQHKMTSRKYWEFLRERSAVRFLQSEAMSIKEIGFRLGFKQASHFTKWFSRRVGVAPNIYRKDGARRGII